MSGRDDHHRERTVIGGVQHAVAALTHRYFSRPGSFSRCSQVQRRPQATSLWARRYFKDKTMGAYRKTSAAFVVTSLLFSACTATTDTDAAAAVAKTVVDDSWRAISDQDVDLLSRVVANDDALIVFGTDAAERRVGPSAFLAAEAQLMQAFDVERLNRRAETFQMHAGGGVAWFSTVFDIEISVDGEPVGLGGLRTTGVIEKRDDEWVIVQLHTSVPVAGQQVEY
jgi:hypothetical protein